MTSAIPYDPYDDIDNNPFSEPQPTSVAPEAESAVATEAQDVHEGPLTQPSEQPDLQPSQEGHVANQNSNSTTTDQAGPQSEQDDSLLPERKLNKYKLVVKVTGLERAGSVTNKKENPTIIFDVSTNLPTFRKPQHRNLRKTLDEFQNLFKFLNGAIPETFIPAIPPPRTSYGISNQEDYQRTVSNFQMWFDRLCADPLILRNEEIAFFMESDLNTYTPVGKVKLPAAGLKRKTLKQLAPPYDECIELAEFRPLVKSIHHQCQEIQLKLFKLCKLKKTLSADENGVGKGFAEIPIDVAQKHGKMYKRFGKTLTAVGDIDSVIATLDMATLHDGLEWIVQDTYVVKEAMTNRHFLMRDLLQAQQNSKFRQEQARKLRAKRDVSPLKVDEAIRQLKYATTVEHELTMKLKRTTANMLLEKQRWLDWYSAFLSTSVKEYTLRKIEYERKKLSLLERIRADVRSADENGGLSRLGRSRSTTSSDLHPSQTAHGDSWAGDARRRSQAFESDVLHTEFDDALCRDEAPASTLNPEDQHALDARNAATLLGQSTF
ncbi:LAFE_0F04082g1_1 [Lachancea fermentati]|uniref:Vacuolar protein sorting-associated protein 17 n=1 Tax=Lachancea fermentati TaxID=4955 RepID=A0A1G4MEH7_LACFM|nr:LAFE_0F04082g1_1 [Lachancea fermentati]